MHRDVLAGEPDVRDLILLVLGPPLFGCAIGLLLSLARRQPGLAATGGSVGGTIGAWAGVVVYLCIDIADLAIFEACVLGGLLLGATPPAWLLAGPKVAAASETGSIAKPIYGIGCGVAIAGVLLSCAGNFLHWLASEPSAFIPIDDSVKTVGVVGILAGMVALILGLVSVRKTMEKRMTAKSNR
jgi:hypothetical protein